MLQWEQPNCRGWEEISYYEVILYSSESKKNKTIESFDKSELVSADVEEATVLATNICEEITLVATGKNDGTYQVYFLWLHFCMPMNVPTYFHTMALSSQQNSIKAIQTLAISQWHRK